MRNSLILAMSLLLPFATPVAHAQDRPNIVVVFMDNFGWGELGWYGGGVPSGVPTPNIDGLADEVC